MLTYLPPPLAFCGEPLHAALRAAALDPHALPHELPEATARVEQAPAPLLLLTTLDDPLLDPLTRLCHRHDQPMLFAGPVSATHFQIGPGTRFGKSACLVCYGFQQEYFTLAEEVGTSGALVEQLPPLMPHLANEAHTFLSGEAASPYRQGRFTRLPLDQTAPPRPYLALKMPGCPVCSPWANHPTELIHL